MSRKKQETKVLCPGCGTEFLHRGQGICRHGHRYRQEFGLGTVYPVVAAIIPRRTSQRGAGAYRGTPRCRCGRELPVRHAGSRGRRVYRLQQRRKLTILDDNDPIFGSIMAQGTVPNNRLFRRWVGTNVPYDVTRITVKKSRQG